MRKGRSLLAIITLLFVSAVSCSLSFAWFLSSMRTSDDQNIDGIIGLRNYYYDGDGSEESPFEIVLPVHLYNLSRLQNLGVYGNKYYFQLGHVFDEEKGPQFIELDENGDIKLDASGNMSHTDTLDMGPFCSKRTVKPIGGEGSPFYGDFEGNGLTISNLTVTGDPEDIGFFGYIPVEGNARDFTLENITVNSVGYDEVHPFDDLFGADVLDIFDETGTNELFSTADLFFKPGLNDGYYLKNDAGVAGHTLSDINNSSNTYTDEETGVTYFNASFLPVYPNDTEHEFEYTWRFSTAVLEKYTDPVDGKEKARANMDVLRQSEEFNDGSNAEIDSRIYLIANYHHEGYTYSRVIQTYVCQFFSNCSSYDDGEYSMTIFCDHTTSQSYNYHHGNNVGFIAGHVDGVLKNCYVLGGQINLNNGTKTGVIETESETGLVGEVGVNVDNEIEGEFGKTEHGDIGIMNFSGIYSMIRSDAVAGDKVWGSFGYEGGTKRNWFAYNKTGTGLKNYLKPTYTEYADYLRHNDYAEGDDPLYIAGFEDKTVDITDSVSGELVAVDKYLNAVNAVDFLPNAVIRDEEGHDRGLGVFQIATAASADNILGGIRQSRIINGEQKTLVYYSTAEFDHTAFPTGTWNTSLETADPGTGNYYLETMGTLPLFASRKTFDPIYERDFNYLFQMDISQTESLGGNNYFYNTDSLFLQEYLKYKLIDKKGETVNYGDRRFGFMLRDAEGQVVDQVSSYMAVKKPTAVFSKVEGDTTKYYPASTITFTIENKNGANVGVIASGAENVTIYSYDPLSSAAKFTAKYSMFNKAISKTDALRYFTAAVDGTTSTESVVNINPTTTTGILFAHIFKLPQGHYCIGSAATDKEANIYMLAVQGQTDSTIGDITVPTLGEAKVDADFLYIYMDGEDKKRGKAKFFFSGDFSSDSGTITVEGDNAYVEILFNNANGFILEMFTYDKKDSPSHYINGVEITEDKHQAV